MLNGNTGLDHLSISYGQLRKQVRTEIPEHHSVNPIRILKRFTRTTFSSLSLVTGSHYNPSLKLAYDIAPVFDDAIEEIVIFENGKS